MKTRRKHTFRLLSVILSLCMIVTVVAPLTVFAESETGWTQDEKTVANGETNEIDEEGWLHLASTTGNSNSTTAGQYPAVFISDKLKFSEKKSFSFTMKTANPSNDRFGVYLGYKDPGNAIFVGFDTQGWFWQMYTNGSGNYLDGDRKAVPAANTETKVEITWTDTTVSLKVDGEVAFSDVSYESIKSTLGDQIAIKCGTFSGQLTDVYLQGEDILDSSLAPTLYTVSGTVKDAEGQPVADARVASGTKSTTTDEKGAFTLKLAEGKHTLVVTKSDYESATIEVDVKENTTVESDIQLTHIDPNAKNPSIADGEGTVTLKSDVMQVQVDRNFPRVHKYIYDGKEIAGQTDKLDKIEINGVSLTPTITSDVASDNSKITYTITCQDTDKNIDCVLTAELKVEDNHIELRFTKIDNKLTNTTNPVQTINIPNHSLVSVQSNQHTPNLMASRISSITYRSGDVYMDLTNATENMNTSYSYAVISNNQLSASVESNTMYEGEAGLGSGGMTDGKNTRINVAVTTGDDGVKSLALASSPWIYETFLQTYDGEGGMEFIKYYDYEDMPYVRVVITSDCNDDGVVNWNDGAIAFRSISHYIPGSETVPEHVTYRICMNFGSQAQNPFLTTLDNVKKVALHMDGLGQSVLLKGYGNEGHDSGHPDYADIGKRIGGADDMITLLEKGAEYGATFGIHINASEMYPEAKAFSDKLVKRNNQTGALSYGWNWIDQGIGINGIYDLVSGERQKRFDALHEALGGEDDMLDFIYLDVWGNATSGNEGTITTRNVGKQITDYWRMGNEWGIGFDWYATMQHWAADLAYGDATAKGHNSNLMRFIRNNEKDSWVADIPSYGGAANAPLLGGMEMYDFEGWQGRNDYDRYIKTVYSHNITTKFFQHFDVIKWVNSENSYTVQGYQWFPEMEITLKDEDGNVVVIKRGSDDVNNSAYRDRTVTYNGVEISNGSVTTNVASASAGTEKYLIPWFWDNDGKDFAADDQKLYHWNTTGGESTWTLIKEWEDCKNVVVYKLTDLGRTDPVTVDVVDGKITIKAEAETPYVVYKGEQEEESVKWSEGMHLVDVSFNAGNLDAWNVTGDATIAKSQFTNPMLKLTGGASVSQTLTDLKAGEKYAVYVGIDNRSDGKASITLTDKDGKVIDSNYTLRSIAKNYVQAYTHSNRSATVDGSSYFQNMYVYFTAPESGDVTLTLALDGSGSATIGDVDLNGAIETLDATLILQNVAMIDITGTFSAVNADVDGNGTIETLDATAVLQKIASIIDTFPASGTGGETTGEAYFDDVRVVENGFDGITKDENGDIVKFENDFENNAQGVYPFVIGPVEGVTDNRTHLSELHAPYTQAGWDVKLLDDVIDGNWSLKVNGLVQGNNLVMQTIPQNFRFEPGVTYTVKFDYQLGTQGTYAVTYGDGEFVGNTPIVTLNKTLKANLAEGEEAVTNTCVFSMTGALDGQSWFGIYSTGVAPDVNDAFMGYKDFVLDNVVIIKNGPDRSALMEAIESAQALDSRDFGADGWADMQKLLASAIETNNNLEAKAADINSAAKALKDAVDALETITCTITGKVVDATTKEPVSGATVTLRASDMQNQVATTGEDGTYAFNEIPIRDYSIMVRAKGYTAKYNVEVDVHEGDIEVSDVQMTPKSGEYDYTNDFATEETILGLEDLPGNNGTVGVAYTDGAAKITFPGGNRNNVVFTDAGTYTNARIEFDLTPAGSSVRFGVVFRAQEMNKRVFVGVGDNVGQYFWEHWNGASVNTWSSMSSGTALEANKKYTVTAELNGRNIKMSINGSEIFSGEIPADATTDDGYIGFECRNSAAFTIDNIKITDLDNQ